MGLFNKKSITSKETTSFSRPVQSTAPKPSSAQASPQKKTLIGNSFNVKGVVRADEEIFINGVVDGKIISKNRVIIGIKGNVKADIEAKEILIKGKVTGNVKGSVKVEVFYNGFLRGNILSKSVVIAEGANFKGNIDMNL